MQSIGNYLKSGREARNIKLSEVARSTKISKWYLDCLEKDEFDKIPSGPYIKGYIASYASFIGLEEEEVLKRYDSLQIENADENEIQDQPPQDKNRQKAKGTSFGKRNLLILSMAALILLVSGVSYYFFQNRTNFVAQVPETQDAKMKSASSLDVKPADTRPQVQDKTAQSAETKGIAKSIEDKSQMKKQTAAASHVTDLSKNKQLNPIKTKDESPATYQDAKGIESLALFSADQNSEPSSNKPSARTDAKNTLPQDTPEAAYQYLDSDTEYLTPELRSQPVNNLRVKRAVAASDVINRNPAGPSDSFQWSMEKVYVWSMIECEQPPSSIRHTYFFKGQIVNEVVLEINSPQWRTWSYKNLLDKRYIGLWRVDITSETGNLLESVFFEVN